MENLLLSNPYLTILIIIIVIYVGKELFLKKDEKEKIEKDVSTISSKNDSGIALVRQELSGALHNLQLRTKDDFTAHSDKFYEKIADTLEKVDQKYVSKEVQQKQDNRMDKFENRLDNIEAMLAEVKTTGDVNTSKLDSVVDMIEALSNKIDKINN